MKTKIRFLLVFLTNIIFMNGFCQTYLTNGQVYDFNVGDIIQARGFGGMIGATSPPTFETKMILSKIYSKNKDTIVYSIKRDNYTVKNCTNCNPIFSTDTINLIITNLTSAVSLNNHSSCGFLDKVYKDYGGLLVWESLPKQDTSCHNFEGVSYTIQYVQGVGGPFYTVFDPSGPLYGEYILVYYKNISGSWGSIYTSIKDEELFTSHIDIFPNPTNGLFYITSLEEFVKFDIVDLSGVHLKTNNIINQSIDISDLKPGLYLVNIFTKDLRKVTKKIQKL